MNIFTNEFKRYKGYLDKSLSQVSDDNFFKQLSENGNSIAIILNHICGNFKSRFTNFLNEDGEKSWRNRDSEFIVEGLSREELMLHWEEACALIEKEIFTLSDLDMERLVNIRGVEFKVDEALMRSLAHFSSHVGQIMMLAKGFNENWEYLTIAPNKSSEYNQNPNKEKG